VSSLNLAWHNRCWHLFFGWQAKNALVGTFFFLDQISWAGKTGIYKVGNQNGINTIFNPEFLTWWSNIELQSLLLTSWMLIYQNEEQVELISRISLFCWMAGTFCTSVVEVCSLWPQCTYLILRKIVIPDASYLLASMFCVCLTLLVLHLVLSYTVCHWYMSLSWLPTATDALISHDMLLKALAIRVMFCLVALLFLMATWDPLV